MREYSARVLADAIWNHQIDNMRTCDIAAHFGLARSATLHFLQRLVEGHSVDTRFEYCPARQGVRIADGSIFTCQPLVITKAYQDRPRHWIWICVSEGENG